MNRPATNPDGFAPALLSWFDQHGRTHLPWQINRTPYRVWISEIMLQQTRVEAVVDYYQRFLQRFPTLPDLAAADLDAVMSLWSGLGYYSRARNLHAAAKICVQEHQGEMPESIEGMMDLPGIGRSTAGAILALSLDHRHPILDGNVKRVLARFHAVEGWPGRSAVSRRLWELAEEQTPYDRVADYTQAIMDLGATLCTPRNPDCGRCPVAADCQARAADRTEDFPEKKPARELPTREAVLAVVQDAEGRLLLERRPPQGIWGGLWCLPQFEDEDAAIAWMGVAPSARAPEIRHTFSHFHLRATPLRCGINDARIADSDQLGWFHLHEASRLGLPTPIRKWIDALEQDQVSWQEPSTV